MDETLAFLKANGWQVRSVQAHLITIHVDPIAIVRAAARLRRSLEDVGVFLYPVDVEDRPRAWATYDASAMRASLYLVLSDEYMPKTRAKREREKRAQLAVQRPPDPSP